VFSSGIMSNKTLKTATEYLLKIPPENLSFVCNYNHPNTSTAAETKQIEKFLTAFSKYTTLSFNLYQKDFDFKFLVDAIIQYGLKKHIRLGLAQPIPRQKNDCLGINEIRGIAKNIRNQLTLLEKYRISINFDCGMPLCIFSDEDVGRLFKLNRGKAQFTCGAAIDIGPDLQVWACFPLSNYEKKSLYDFNHVDEIKKLFSVQHDKIRKEKSGIFEECNSCVHFEEHLCMGGCLAHFISDK
jgi:radical SAM protein with 4Fe4S-binding SPASM domain